MNTQELQQLKMAWLAAKEAKDVPAQISLLRDHPEAQELLIDFIAAYRATSIETAEEPLSAELAPLAQRASQLALQRVFEQQQTVANLSELRKQRGFTLMSAARELRLSVDVWKKFETGAIELVSLSERQLERLAQFFQVSAEQFGNMLLNSQPVMTMNRRQTSSAARNEQQSPKKQSFKEAIEKSTMSKEEKLFWRE